MASQLDSKYTRCGLLKFGMAIPFGGVISLIGYISYQFIWNFIPHAFKVSNSIID